MATKHELSTAETSRILEIVKKPQAPAAKIKTAFLSVVGQDIRAAGYTVEEVRESLIQVEQNGVVAAEEPATEEVVDTTPKQGKGARVPRGKPRAEKAATKPKAEKAPKEKKTRTPRTPKAPVEVTPKDAKAILAERQKEDPEKWGKVRSIAEFTDKGKPSRVVIQCKDPETDEFIKDTREIAVQDLFQVHYTPEGAKRARSLSRRASRRANKPEPKPKAEKQSKPKAAKGGGKRAKAKK